MAQVSIGKNPTKWEPWQVVLAFIVVLLIGIGVLLAGMWFIPTYLRLVLWIVVLILMSAFALVIGFVINRRWMGILIDGRNKVSLSRFQIIIWLILIASAFLAVGLSNLHISLSTSNLHTSLSTPLNALSITVPAELLALLGVTATSLVGTPFILRVKSRQHEIHTKDDPRTATWSDMFKGDDQSNFDSVDLSKVQMFYITIILVLVYGAALAAMFIENTSNAIFAFPALSATMVTLLGISNAGYLGYKAVPHNVGQSQASSGGSGNQVPITQQSEQLTADKKSTGNGHGEVF